MLTTPTVINTWGFLNQGKEIFSLLKIMASKDDDDDDDEIFEITDFTNATPWERYITYIHSHCLLFYIAPALCLPLKKYYTSGA